MGNKLSDGADSRADGHGADGLVHVDGHDAGKHPCIAPGAGPCVLVENPLRVSYISELDAEETNERTCRSATGESGLVWKRLGAGASIVLTITITVLMNRASEAVPCGPLALGPEFDVGNCLSVNAGTNCDVHCAPGYAHAGINRVSAQYNCPGNNRNPDSPPSGSGHPCVDINECAGNPCANDAAAYCLDSTVSTDIPIATYRCECIDGFTNQQIAGSTSAEPSCRPCSVCPAGQLIASPCTRATDTVCASDGGVALHACFAREDTANVTLTTTQNILATKRQEHASELDNVRAYYTQQLRRLHCVLPAVAHGDISGDTIFGGNGINITCHHGYALSVGEAKQIIVPVIFGYSSHSLL
jgi:hypothetical protein